MATNHSRRTNAQAQAMLSLSTDLQHQLTCNDDSDIPAPSKGTLELLEKTLHRLPLLLDSASTSTRRQLDNEATKLWNICILRQRTAGESKNDSVLLCKVRVLAYTMLEAAAPRTGPGNYRSLELAFKVVKVCIEHHLIDWSQKIMESAATRLDLMERSKTDTDMIKLEVFTTEYYMLRIYLAWSQERLDIADHLFSKIPETKTTEQQGVVVDICYMIGDRALRAGQYDTATTWLGRALTVCELWSSDESHTIGQRLKDNQLLVLHAYARANLHLTTAASEGQFRRAFDLLRTEYGNFFPVLVFSLEVLSKKDELNEEYVETLKSSIKEMDNGDTSVKIIYQYIMKIRNFRVEPFVEICGKFLNKLAGLDMNTKGQWMEKIFVSIIWTLTNTNTCEDHCPNLAEATAQILTECDLGEPSEDATQASLILIWKYIDTMLSKGTISIAEQWCRFLLEQPMFQKIPGIEGKSFRKLVLCVLENYNHSTARQLFDGIPKVCKACPLTLYLMYRLALLADDATLSTVYIKSLCKQGSDATYICSCVADALQLGKTDIAIQSLKDAIAVWDDGNGFETLQIPQLLQCVIENIANREGFLENVISLLSSALTVAGTGQRKTFSSVDLRWFSCKSYSIVLELCKLASAHDVVKLLDISIKFMELGQNETRAELNTDLLEHHLRCTFLQSTIIVTEARREKSFIKKENHYKEAREAIKQFQSHIPSPGLASNLNTHLHKWLDKYRILLSFDFEATVFLRQWDDVAKIIEISKPIADVKLSSVFLDCLLQSGAPSSYLSQFVKQMIQTFHSPPSPVPFLHPESESKSEPVSSFSRYLPRHLRCLFSLSIQAEEYILAESVLDQALVLARDNRGTTQASYGEDELQWLATSGFNRAVEFFLVSADEDCRRWAGKAIALADLIEEDRGRLGRLLRCNFAKIQPNLPT